MKTRIIFFLIVMLIFLAVPIDAGFISLEKTEYRLGDIVSIDIIGPIGDLNLEIDSPSNVYKYLGVPSTEMRFIPKEAGDYEIRLKDSNGLLIEAVAFKVSIPVFVFPGTSRIKIKNSKNEILSTKFNVYKEGVLTASGDTLNSQIQQGTGYDVELLLNRETVKKIRFRNAGIGEEFDLGYEELPNDTVSMPWKITEAVYAIDPTQLSFDDAIVTAVAKGTELYKCKEYNFTTRTCYGTYTKVMDIVPGQEYTFTLTPEDPQYTEQTSSLQGCACTNTCTTATGGASQCTATCSQYCNVNFTVPAGASSGWIEKVDYYVTITLSGTGTAVSGSHEGRLDKDTTPNSANDVQIGTSTVATKTANSVVFSNTNLPDSGTSSFDNNACTTWSSGYCTWKPYLTSSYTCSGNRRTCITTISLTLINYTWEYTGDSTPPTITLGNPINNSFSSTRTNTFYYTPDDNVALSNCSIYINGALNQTNSTLTKGIQTTFTVLNMIDSQHSWYIMCFDTSGNSLNSGTKYLNVDATKPGVSIVPPSPSNNTYLSVNYLDINISHIESNPDKLIFYWNSVPDIRSYSGTSSLISKTSLSDNTYNYYVWLNDSAANMNQTGLYYVTIDTSNPTVVLNEPSNNGWVTYNNGIVFNFTPTDTNLNNCSLYGNFSGVFSLNQTKTILTSGVKNSFDPIHLNDGIYVWNVLCYDKAGRSAWYSSNYTVKLDSLPPVVNMLQPANNTYWNISNEVMFNYTVTDNFAVNNCTLKTISNVSTQIYEKTDISLGILQNFTEIKPNNNYNWTIQCTDPAGNTNQASYYNLTIFIGEDLVGPVVVLNSPANNNWTNLNQVIFKFTPTDTSLIKNCSLYVNDVYNQTKTTITNAIQNNFTINGMSQGIYSWYVNCTDNSTNKNTGVSYTYGFTIDTVAPSASLIFPGAYQNLTYKAINFTWYATDALSSMIYCDLSINKTTWASDVFTLNNSHGNYSVSLTDEGDYYWNVTCRDQAYNYYSTPTREFTIDTLAPEVNLISPLDYNVSLTGNFIFYFIPSDNNTGLSQCELYINSSLNQTKTSLLNNQQNNFTLNNIDSGNYNWQVLCKDKLLNTGYSGVRNFYVDTIHPRTNSYTAAPTTADPGQFVNITVNVTDNFAVDKVIAEITPPGGSPTNYSMSPIGTDFYNFTYTSTSSRGTYSVRIISNDTNSNKNISQYYYFYVKAGVSVNKIYYDRGEQVIITGGGFDSGDNITINATDPDGFMALGLPTTVLANSTGGFQYVWTISTSSGQATGNYTIKAFDTYSPGQSGSAYAYLVRRPSTALRYDKTSSGTNVVSQINDSEDTRASIVPGSGEDWIEITWTNIVPAGQTISDVRVYTEHYETALYPVYILWWNSTSSTWKDICTMVATSTEKIDACDLNDEVLTSALANNLLLRISDKNSYGASTGTWTNIDFLYIEVSFTTLIVDKTEYQQGENVTITGSKWPHDSSITLNITRSNGTTDQVTTTTNSNGDFTKTYQVPFDGSLGTYNVTVYETGNPTDIDTTSFNVIKRNSSIYVDRYYYSRPETVSIIGRGFSSGGNVNVLIYDAKNVLRVNQTITASQDINGTISYGWAIPSDYTGYYGQHYILVRDSLYYNLNGTANINVGITSINATRTQNSVTTDMSSVVNLSDNSSAALTIYNSVEDMIRLNFTEASLQNKVLSNLTFYVEHRESQLFDIVIEWWNNTNWVDVCRIPYSSTEKVTGCDILPFVERSPRTQSMLLKITDNQTNFGVSGSVWTNIDYTYLVSWSEDDTIAPSVKIIAPSGIYNYSQQVLIRVNVSENVQVDNVYANITWPLGSELISLSQTSVNYYGEGIYDVLFNHTTYLGDYNLTFFVNDTSGNLNNTEKTSFTIASADLTSNSSYLIFSKTIAVENENISINLTIFNKGNANASSFIVRFYDGTYTLGEQIGQDIIINSLDAGKNTTLSTSWISKIGIHNIQAVIDAPVTTNGSIWELNETNNIVNKEILVPSYNIYYGSASGLIRLDTASAQSEFQWNSTSAGKIYVIETGTPISWLELQALGRDASNLSAIDDFHQADLALGIENNTDSINNTYTDNNLPVVERDIEIYGRTIRNVPFMNSTNSSDFQTGILWDTSDGGPGYTGVQDLIFITQVNKGKPSIFGIVDYEISIPATLDSYKLSSGTVTFYSEIT